jgi:hypothetical protein
VAARPSLTHCGSPVDQNAVMHNAAFSAVVW